VGSVERPEYLRRRSFGELLRSDLGFLPVLLTLLIVVAFFAITTGGVFLEPYNLSNLAQQGAEVGVVGLGAILVLLIGEIDLSVAAVAVLCSGVMAVCTERLDYPAWVAIALALLSGAAIGALNGVLVAVVRVPAFIVTLAGSIAYSGLLLLLLNGQATLPITNAFVISLSGSPLSFLPDSYGIGLPALAVILYAVGLLLSRRRRRALGLRTSSPMQVALQIAVVGVLVAGAVSAFENYNGVPYSTGILFGLIVLFWLILTKTSFGRHIYAVGGNIEAARRAGINVVAIRIAVFTLCSVLATVGGILEASRTNAVATQVSSTLLLEAIAAAVIGGVSLFGGRGSIWAIVLGMLVIESIKNGLTLQSQPTYVQDLVEGIVLVLAVMADALVRRFQARSGR
jgi:D-xylose transport system permease protein